MTYQEIIDKGEDVMEIKAKDVIKKELEKYGAIKFWGKPYFDETKSVQYILMSMHLIKDALSLGSKEYLIDEAKGFLEFCDKSFVMQYPVTLRS